MSGFITCVRTVRYEQPIRREGKNAMPPPRRVVTFDSPEVLRRALEHVVGDLPVYRGAGPCGTIVSGHRYFDPNKLVGQRFLCDPGVARVQIPCPSPIEWALRVLWPHLVQYYASRGSHHPRELGARTGPRGRQPAGAL